MTPHAANVELTVTGAHGRAAEEVRSALGVGVGVDGLSEHEAHERRDRVGPNLLPEPARAPAWLRFLSHFNDTLIYILLAAAAIKAVDGRLARLLGDRLGRRDQRGDRLRAGRARREGARRHPRHAVHRCDGASGRTLDDRARCGSGARRPRAAHARRQGAGRCPYPRGVSTAHRRGGSDGGVGALVEGSGRRLRGSGRR